MQKKAKSTGFNIQVILPEQFFLSFSGFTKSIRYTKQTSTSMGGAATERNGVEGRRDYPQPQVAKMCCEEILCFEDFGAKMGAIGNFQKMAKIFFLGFLVSKCNKKKAVFSLSRVFAPFFFAFQTPVLITLCRNPVFRTRFLPLFWRFSGIFGHFGPIFQDSQISAFPGFLSDFPGFCQRLCQRNSSGILE